MEVVVVMAEVVVVVVTTVVVVPVVALCPMLEWGGVMASIYAMPLSLILLIVLIELA